MESLFCSFFRYPLRSQIHRLDQSTCLIHRHYISSVDTSLIHLFRIYVPPYFICGQFIRLIYLSLATSCSALSQFPSIWGYSMQCNVHIAVIALLISVNRMHLKVRKAQNCVGSLPCPSELMIRINASTTRTFHANWRAFRPQWNSSSTDNFRRVDKASGWWRELTRRDQCWSRTARRSINHR